MRFNGSYGSVQRFVKKLKEEQPARIWMDLLKMGFVVDGGGFGSNLRGILEIQIEEIFSLLNSCRFEISCLSRILFDAQEAQVSSNNQASNFV